VRLTQTQLATLARRRRMDRGANGGVRAYPNATFYAPLNVSGQAALSQSITINSTTVTPTFLYTGDNGAATWTATVGSDVAVAGTGDAPTYDQGSPFGVGGGADTSVRYLAAKYHSLAGFASADSDDLIVEVIAEHTAGGGVFIGSLDGNNYWRLQTNGAGTTAQFLLYDTVTLSIISATTTLAWNHYFIVCDRSGSGIMYVNGSAGSAAAISSTGDIDSSGGEFAIGAGESGATPLTGRIAYAAMWQSAGWLDTHLQATLAQTRYAQLCGVMPAIARGTALPSVMTRASVAYLRNDSASPVMYYVGSGHMRVEDWTTDAGYYAELAATNLCLQSGDLSTTWTAVANTTNTNSAAAPTGDTVMDAVVTADAITDTQHGWQQAITLTAVSYVASCWAKKGAQNFLYLADDTVANSWAYFNLNTGAVGNKGAGANASGIEDWGGGAYRCWFTVTGTVAAHTFSVYASDADDNAANPAYVGDGASDDVYVWGVQVELGTYPTSYIPTTTGTASRVADSLRYTGNDGNCKQTPGYTVSADCLLPNVDLSADQPTIVMLAKDGTDRAHLYEASDRTTAWYSQMTGESGGSSVDAANLDDGAVHTLAGHADTNNHYIVLDGTPDSTPDVDVGPVTGVATILVGEHIGAARPSRGLVSNVKLKDRV